jgi:hypothetical protein
MAPSRGRARVEPGRDYPQDYARVVSRIGRLELSGSANGSARNRNLGRLGPAAVDQTSKKYQNIMNKVLILDKLADTVRVRGFLWPATGALLLCCCMPLRSGAQLVGGDSISFQGALSGPNGQPLPNGPYSLTFKFYDVPINGTPLATSSVPNVTLAGGIVSTAIPAEAAWFSNGIRYVGISVSGANAGQELSPRVLITSVPYAMSARGISGARLSTSSETGDLIFNYEGYQAGDAEYSKIRHLSRAGGWADATSIQPDSEVVFGKVDGFDPDWTHGSYIAFKTTPNSRDVPPSESGRFEPAGIRLYHNEYQSGSIDYSHIQHFAKDGHWPDSPTHADAEIVFGKTDGFDTNWTHGSYISFRTTPNNRDVSPFERMRITADGVKVNTLQITGGSDLAEPFDVTPTLRAAETRPGMVMVIDPDHDGKLTPSSKPYDTAVAGVLSGANGLSPGMLMKAESQSLADGSSPLAIAGRVWCWAEASNGRAIKRGDRLTTSPTAGHAMRVSDSERAPGAVIGKAMSELRQGRGLVLVLVNLQ